MPAPPSASPSSRAAFVQEIVARAPAETYTAHPPPCRAVQSNEVYLTPCTTAASFSFASASDKRYSLSVTVNIPNQSVAIREHAWKYFEIHANQRVVIFNYFLVVSGAIAAGLATTLQGTARFSALGILLGVLLSLVAFVFWKLDQRVSFLIKRAELALSEAEAVFPVAAAQLFMFEPESTKAEADSSSWWSRHWTYGKSFRFVFGVMALFGILGAVLSALKFAGVITW